MLHHVDRVLVNQRAHQRFFFERISNRQRFVSSQKFLSHFVGDRFVHDDAPRRSATLASGANRAEKYRLRSHFEIGARSDDERIVAAEFHDGSSQSAMNRFRDVQTHAY